MRRAGLAHLTVAVMALALAFGVTHQLWRDPATRAIAVNPGDQAFFEWLLGYGVHTLRQGANPFFTDLLNTPLGVNLAANTSITVYAILFAPVTFLAGPSVSFLSILTLNLAGSAFAWFAFLNRWVVRHPGAAALGGLFCGFAPGFISHANGHLNWTAGWIAPVLLWRVFGLREPGRWLRNGVVLGLLVVVAFSIAAEGLFFTALVSAVFLCCWAVAAPNRQAARAAAPTVAAGLAVTAAVAGTLLAYPLWMHFAGPQSFSGTGFSQRTFAEDLLAYASYSTRSLAMLAGRGSDLAPNDTEETSFFGPPLVVLVGVAISLLWRRARPDHRATLRALLITGGTFFLLSLGPRLKVDGRLTDLPLPYDWLGRLPLFDAALPGRLALVVVGVVGIVLALTTEQLLTAPPRARWIRVAWTVGFVVALVPLAPTPLPWAHRPPVPGFITQGTWRQYVPDGSALTSLPLPTNAAPDGQRWQAAVLAAGRPSFRMPAGYFLGPGGPDGVGRIGAPPRPTAKLFEEVMRSGRVPRIDRFVVKQARIDFAYWETTAIAIPDEVAVASWWGRYDARDHRALKDTVTALLGPPVRVDDVWLWTVVPGIDPPAGP